MNEVSLSAKLENAAGEFARYDLSLPEPLSESAPLMTRISDNMFRARVQQLKGLAYRGIWRMRLFV